MLQQTPTAVSPWLYLVAIFIGGLFGGGGIVAIYRTILDRRAQRVQLQNTDADTELKRLQQAKTVTEMLAMVTDELKGTLEVEKDNTERMRAMQMQIDKLNTRCQRLDVLETELKIANMQIQRARRAGYLDQPDVPFTEGGTGNPAAVEPGQG